MIDKEDYEEKRCVLCMNDVSRIPIERIIEKLDSYIDDKQFDRAYSHLNYWLEEAKNCRDEAGELVILGELMGFCRKNGKMNEAKAYAESGISKVKRYGFGDSVTGATTLLNAGTVYRACGEPQKSFELYSSAERIYEENLQGNDTRLGGLYNNYASTLTELGDYETALDKYLKALKVMNSSPNGKLECAITYLNMADLFEKKGTDIETEKKIDEMLDKAYELLTDESIERDPYFEFVLDKCIPAYDHYGQFVRSAELSAILSDPV